MAVFCICPPRPEQAVEHDRHDHDHETRLEPQRRIHRLSARTTGTPSPSAPTSAAITTIDSDSMIVWVSPAMICGRA